LSILKPSRETKVMIEKIMVRKPTFDVIVSIVHSSPLFSGIVIKIVVF